MNFITELVKEIGITKIIFEYKEMPEQRKNMLDELKEVICQSKVEYKHDISSFGGGLYEEWFCAIYRDGSKSGISITKDMDLNRDYERTYSWYLYED